MIPWPPPERLQEACTDCGNRHPAGECEYPRLVAAAKHATCRDLSPDEDRFLRWLAGWDRSSIEAMMSLLGAAAPGRCELCRGPFCTTDETTTVYGGRVHLDCARAVPRRAVGGAR